MVCRLFQVILYGILFLHSLQEVGGATSSSCKTSYQDQCRRKHKRGIIDLASYNYMSSPRCLQLGVLWTQLDILSCFDHVLLEKASVSRKGNLLTCKADLECAEHVCAVGAQVNS
jgi:hypothetical protein